MSDRLDDIIVANAANSVFCRMLFDLAEEAIFKRSSLFCNTVEIFRNLYTYGCNYQNVIDESNVETVVQAVNGIADKRSKEFKRYFRVRNENWWDQHIWVEDVVKTFDSSITF